MSNKNPPEILAPAGSREQLEAALRSGADAVYFGASDFNARRGAKNFTDADFLAAVDDCKKRGVKVNVTLNTLVTDAETERLTHTLRLIARSGADAVIVQDLAVASLVKRHVPTLPLHASTQMAVHNVSGARALEEMGFSRIVLARELSEREIRAITEAVGCETEVFVHGAHCMSVSGLCYMSSVFGGRSGNRGLCAQPCRLDFRNDERDHALSLKDLSLIPHLERLADAGVSSFKIEGRMKRPEYVAAAVNAVKTALNGQTPDMDTLTRVFSRSGFTDGYFLGRPDGRMFGYRSREDVVAAAGVLPSLKALYKDEPKRVGLAVSFSLTENAPASLTLSDGKRTVTVTGDVPAPAVSAPTTHEKAETNLTKFGGTPYFKKSFSSEIAPGLMLPASALNALRRDALSELDRERASFFHPFIEDGGAPASAGKTEPARPGRPPVLRLRFGRANTLFDSPAAEKLILDISEILRFPDKVRPVLPKLVCELPVLIYPGDEDRVRQALRDAREFGVKEVLCENIGAVKLAQEAGLTPLGGMHLNILNSLALGAYEALGVTDNTLSFELNLRDAGRLTHRGKVGLLGYGKLPLMRLRACPNRGETGCGTCKGRAFVRDRRGEAFPLLCADRRFSTLHNPIPLCVTGLSLPPVDFVTLYFTDESRDEAERITRDFLAGKKPASPVTAGLYNKKLL